MSEVTRILSAIEGGDPSAAGELLPLVYEELRKLAAQRLAQEKPGQTLQATTLVHEALRQLEAKDPRKAELVRLRFFAGLTTEQAAAALGVSLSTAEKDWAYARSWLRLAINRISGDRS